MRCPDAQQMLSARHDGELDPIRGQALREHLARCRDCEQFAADLARFRPDPGSLVHSRVATGVHDAGDGSPGGRTTGRLLAPGVARGPAPDHRGGGHDRTGLRHRPGVRHERRFAHTAGRPGGPGGRDLRGIHSSLSPASRSGAAIWHSCGKRRTEPVGRLIWSKATLLCVLTISLAFNAGFGTTFAVRTYGHRQEERRKGPKGSSVQGLLQVPEPDRGAEHCHRVEPEEALCGHARATPGGQGRAGAVGGSRVHRRSESRSHRFADRAGGGGPAAHPGAPWSSTSSNERRCFPPSTMNNTMG